MLENDGSVDGRCLKGERVLFLHTGGAYGNFDGRFEVSGNVHYMVMGFA